MKKLTLRTKIYILIVGLLAITGALYAATPVFFTNVSFATGVAAAPDLLLVTPYCNDEIDKVDCDGTVSFFASIPGFGTCREKYMATVPSTSGPPNNLFSPRDVFVTVGAFVFRVDINTQNATPWAFMNGCVASDHNGITFDHQGTFGYDMLVTCREGNVFRIHGDGSGGSAPIATVNAGEIEGPAVAPQSFGPLGGQLLVADEILSAVHAIRNNNPPGPGPYSVTLNVFTHPTAEGVFAIPQPPCTFCTGPNAGAFFQAIQDGQQIWKTLLGAFAGLGGDILLTSETTGQTVSVHWDGTQYVTTPFQNIQGINEGSSFVDCAVPTATPTSTPTATFTPTATSTATATFTPTSTATFTPTATATFTPTATATFTPTATATPTFTPCGALSSCTPPYPFTSTNPRTSIAFNESEVQKCFKVTTTPDGCTPTTVQVFYNDEHALTLGIRQVQVKQSCTGGTTATFTTDYPISPMAPPGNPQSVNFPLVGSQIPDGDQAGTDTAGRPMFPALFITDVTYNPPPPADLAGDWQYGGTAYPPSFVSGTWKAAVRIVDKTNNTVTVTPDADPPKNNWTLGPGADPLCSPTPQNEGYGAEIRWNIADLGLEPGHRYRLYFMEHDGDQNKVGGDSGQGCAFITMPGGPPPPQSPTPTASPTPTPTPTATATPAGVVVGGKLLGPSGATKTVVVTFQNNTGSNQVLTALSFNWPQNPNGNLTKIQMGGSTIFNTSTGGGSVTIPSFPSNTATARTIGPGACGVVTFTFQNNVSTNPALYTPPGSATFTPFGPVSF